MDAKISPSFWADQVVENQPPEFKLTFLWLITNGETNKLGFCKCSAKRFAFETGLTADWLARACNAHPKGIISTSDGYFLPTYIAHQLGRGDQLKRNRLFSSLLSEFESLKPDIQQVVSGFYPEFVVRNPKKHMPITSPSDGVGEGEGEGEESLERGAGENSQIAEIFTLDDVMKANAVIGLPQSECESLFHNYNSQNWLKANGQRITNLHSAISIWKSKWEANGRKPLYATNKSTSNQSGQGPDRNNNANASQVGKYGAFAERKKAEERAKFRAVERPDSGDVQQGQSLDAGCDKT